MDEKTLWTKTLSEEFWSGVVSPLMFSIAGDLIEERMARKGIEMAGLKGLEHERFFRLFGGQVYINCRILEEIVKLIPSAFLTPEMLRFFPREIQEDLSGIRVAFFSRETFKILFRLFGMDRHWAPFFNYRAFEGAVARIQEVRREWAGVDVRAASTSELLQRSRTLCREMGDFLDVVTWGMVFAYVFHPLTEILSRKWGGDEDGSLASSLTVGLDGIKTFEISREIELLADSVDRDPWLSRLFATRRAATILKTLRSDRRAEGFRRMLDAFLDRHGHRFLGRDILFSTWREAPETVIDMIRLNRGSDRFRRSFQRQQQRRRNAESRLRRAIRQGPVGPPKLALFALSLAYDQRYFVIRENMRYYSDFFLEHFRNLYMEIGRRWQGEGMLKRPEDIVYLTKEEVESFAGQGGSPVDVVAKRKTEYKRYHHLRTPEVITDDTRLQPLTRTRKREGSHTLGGEPASPGSVTGRARVIRKPRDVLSFRQGEVLVAEYTDPSWTPVLSLAAGIVLEAGGYLSHGSIVAREYGIPALIQVEGLLDGVETGDKVELDTQRRRVRIERADAADAGP